MRLNIGAGGTKKDGFVSVDAFNNKADIIKPADNTGFGEESIDEIFSSHMLEHIDRSELIPTLKHWHKILKKGSRVVVLVPNAELYLIEWIEAANRGDYKHLQEWGTRWIMGWEGKGVGMYHTNLFHPKTLELAFVEAGFDIVNANVIPTRVKNTDHFEYRKNGDIECVAIK